MQKIYIEKTETMRRNSFNVFLGQALKIRFLSLSLRTDRPHVLRRSVSRQIEKARLFI